jgi:hypothetical protein
MICKDCEKRKSGNRKPDTPAGYCDMCGYGFLRSPEGEITNVTCLKLLTYQQALEMGAFGPDKPEPQVEKKSARKAKS